MFMCFLSGWLIDYCPILSDNLTIFPYLFSHSLHVISSHVTAISAAYDYRYYPFTAYFLMRNFRFNNSVLFMNRVYIYIEFRRKVPFFVALFYFIWRNNIYIFSFLAFVLMRRLPFLLRIW